MSSWVRQFLQDMNFGLYCLYFTLCRFVHYGNGCWAKQLVTFSEDSGSCLFSDVTEDAENKIYEKLNAVALGESWCC